VSFAGKGKKTPHTNTIQRDLICTLWNEEMGLFVCKIGNLVKLL